MLRLGWFSTGRDEAARQLLQVAHDNIARGVIRARTEFVFSNREPGEFKQSDLFFDLVQSYGIPLICHSSRRFRERRGGEFDSLREVYDREIMTLLSPFHPDLCVLAGYMLIVSEAMCRHYTMINLHPAAPGGPVGTWQEVIWQLLETNAQKAGVTWQVVTPDLDRGPPLTYCTFPIVGGLYDGYRAELRGRSIAEIKASEGESNRLFQYIRQQGVLRELPMLVATLKTLADGSIRVEHGRVLDAQGNVMPGHCLNDEIERIIAERHVSSA